MNPIANARSFLAALLPLAPALSPFLEAQAVTLANPNWNITLTDAGYSDFLLDNTPGYEGREYLSGEWGGAIGFTRADGSGSGPRWLERNFAYPDWATNSDFSVVTPIHVSGSNASGLPIATSVLSNGTLEVTLVFEMVDTVTGMQLGLSAASAPGAGSSVTGDRYALRQLVTVRNASSSPLASVQYFQLLHGINSTGGVADSRSYGGVLADFRHDITLHGMDPNQGLSLGSPDGLLDYLSFQASMPPSGVEIGNYGIEGNGVDEHWLGKPSDGVHRSIEANWGVPPYAARLGRDAFNPGSHWVAGAQRFDLGPLAPGASVSIELMLSLATGTRVVPGGGGSGSCGGGAVVPGGMDYSFDDADADGACFSSFDACDAAELEARLAAGEFPPPDFQSPGESLQVWRVHFEGTRTGTATLTFAYDPAALPGSFDPASLKLHVSDGSSWSPVPTTVDAVAGTVSCTVADLGTFALGSEPLVSFLIDTSAEPAGAGSVAGGGLLAQGSRVALVAESFAGFAFAGWWEGGTQIGFGSTLLVDANADRTIVAKFSPLSGALAISTKCLPAGGGTTAGDGAYAEGATVAVSAVANPGFKFSKWILNGSVVSTAANYSFTAVDSATLTAKFKPVFEVLTEVEPADSGEVSADTLFEVGDPVELKAQPSDGYSFLNWTQNGIVVSTEPIFSFTTTTNRFLVAHFALGNRVDVSMEPPNGGAVAGAGVYAEGVAVSISAQPKDGYVFLEWIENGNRVSTAPSLTFTPEKSRSLIARFGINPRFTCDAVAGGLELNWPLTAPDWVLQETDDLASGVWTDVLLPVNAGSEAYGCTVPGPATSGTRYYRIVYR